MFTCAHSLLVRDKVEVEFAPLYERGLGLTTWSPLASGVLTGKYRDGIPEGSRLGSKEFKKNPKYQQLLSDVARAEALRPLAEEMGCSMGQLSIAWCLRNMRVSTVITGASSVKQLEENLGALDVAAKLEPRHLAALDSAFAPPPKARHEQQVQFRLRPLRSHY